MLLYILILLDAWRFIEPIFCIWMWRCQRQKKKYPSEASAVTFFVGNLIANATPFFLLCSILQFLSSIFTRYCVLFCCLHCVFWSFMFYFFLFLLCLCNMVPLKCSFVLICFGIFCNSLPMVHTWYKQLAGYRVCTLWLK